MEFLDVTSIRDTRFGKFAKMPKVGRAAATIQDQCSLPVSWGKVGGDLMSEARTVVSGLRWVSSSSQKGGRAAPSLAWALGFWQGFGRDQHLFP